MLHNTMELIITSNTKEEAMRIVEYRRQVIKDKPTDLKLANIQIVKALVNESVVQTYVDITKKVRERYEAQGAFMITECDRVGFEDKTAQILRIYADVINEMNLGTIFQRAILAKLARDYSIYRGLFIAAADAYDEKAEKFMAELKTAWKNVMFALASEDDFFEKFGEFLSAHGIYLSPDKAYCAEPLKVKEIRIDPTFASIDSKYYSNAPPDVSEELRDLIDDMKEEYETIMDSNMPAMRSAMMSLHKKLAAACDIKDFSKKEYIELRDLIEAIRNIRESSLYDSCFGKDTYIRREYDKTFKDANTILREFPTAAYMRFTTYLQNAEEPLYELPLVQHHLKDNVRRSMQYMQRLLLRVNQFDFPTCAQEYICKMITNKLDVWINFMEKTAKDTERISQNYVINVAQDTVDKLMDRAGDTDALRVMYLAALRDRGIVVVVGETTGQQLIRCKKIADIIKVMTINPDFSVHSYATVDENSPIPDERLVTIIKRIFIETFDTRSSLAEYLNED